MSDIAFEESFPMAEGPGAGADRWRWRRMARLWADSGVVRRAEAVNMLHFHGWQEPGLVAISAGAVWMNGFYGESLVDRWLSTPGDDGMVMAVLDPFEKTVRLEWGPGIHGDMDRFNAWSDHYWQLGLWELNGFGNVTDVRKFVPPERQLPPLVEVPDFVPKPFFRRYQGNGLVTVSTTPQFIWTVPVASDPGQVPIGDFVPGRNYRVTWYFHSPFWRDANNWGGLSNAECALWDHGGERTGRLRAYSVQLGPAGPTSALMARTVSAVLPAADAGFSVGVTAWTTQNFTADTWGMQNIFIEVTDVGHGAVAG
jgi:hypothetical protein